MSSSKRRSKGSLNLPSQASAANTSLPIKSPANRTPNRSHRSPPVTHFDQQLLSVLRKCRSQWDSWLLELGCGQVYFDACVVHLLRRIRIQVSTEDDDSSTTASKEKECLVGLLDGDAKLSGCLFKLMDKRKQVVEQLERLDALILLQQSPNTEWKTNLRLVRLDSVKGIVVAFESALYRETVLRRELVQCLVYKDNTPAVLNYLRIVWDCTIFVDVVALEDIRRAILEELGADDIDMSFSEH